MPTTFVELALFALVLTPGFLYASQRRQLVPEAERSALMETASILTVSIATNVAAIVAFGGIRAVVPDHTPNVSRLLTDGNDYWIRNLPYVITWLVALFAASCGLAVAAARSNAMHNLSARAFPAVVRDSSAWNEVFQTDTDHYPHLGLELSDGGYLQGRLVWFSTDLEESPDRELVLAQPLSLRAAGGTVHPLRSQRVVIAARQIDRIDFTPVIEPAGEVDESLARVHSDTEEADGARLDYKRLSEAPTPGRGVSGRRTVTRIRRD